MGKYNKIITEEIDAADEIIKSDGSINFNSFSIKDELNPDIFDGNKMKPEIREQLLNLYKNIIKDSYIVNEENTDDVVIVGSLVSYHYSSYSDVDFHIIVNMNDFGSDSELVKEFLNDERKLWNIKHDIQVAGYDVEIYYQDIDEIVNSNGCYSILKDEWVKFPDKENYELDKKEIERKALFYMDKIDNLAEKDDLSDDEVIKLWDKIKDGRREDININGEFSVDNIVFKILRRTGHLEKLSDLKTKIIDNSMLESNKVEINPIIEKLIRKSTRKLLSGETKAEPAEWDGRIINDALGEGMFENTDKKLWIPYYIIIRDEMKSMDIKILEQKQEVNNMKKINFGVFNSKLYESVKDYCKTNGKTSVSRAEVIALIENEMANIDKCEVDECGDTVPATECVKPTAAKDSDKSKNDVSEEDTKRPLEDLAIITVTAFGDSREDCRQVITEKIRKYAKEQGIDKVNLLGVKCKEMRTNYDGSAPKYTVTMNVKVDGIYGELIVLEDECGEFGDSVDECVKRALDECDDMQ